MFIVKYVLCIVTLHIYFLSGKLQSRKLQHSLISSLQKLECFSFFFLGRKMKYKLDSTVEQAVQSAFFDVVTLHNTAHMLLFF